MIDKLKGGKIAIATPALIVVLGLLIAMRCDAQTYPTKPVRIVAPFAAGGTVDVIARLIAQKLTEAWGQQFIIDNRPGGSGIVGGGIVARSRPDGYTLAAGTMSTHAILQSLYSKLPYDPVKDFTPITQTVSLELMLVVHPSLPATSVKQLIALVKARPGQLNYASGGVATIEHLAAELFNSIVGTRMEHVPYNGNAPAIVDLLGGHVMLIFELTSAVIPHVKSGRLRALAVLSGKRSPLMPELPAIAETEGLTTYDVAHWHGLFAPAGTPREIVQKLYMEIARILRGDDMRQRLSREGAAPVASTPEEFAAYQKSEAARWAKLVKALGVKAE